MYFCPFLDIWGHTSCSLCSGMFLYRLLGWIGTDGVNWDRWCELGQMGELGHPISRLSLSLRWFASNFPNNPIYPYSPCPSQSTPDLKLFELPVSSTLEVWDRPAWIPLVPHLTGTGRDIVFSHAHVTLYEGLSVRPSVGQSPFFLTAEFKPKSDPTSINAPAQCLRLMWSCIQTCLT